MQSEDRRADRIGQVHRARIRAQQQRRALQQGQQLFQRVLADQIHRLLFAGSKHGVAELALVRARPAA